MLSRVFTRKEQFVVLAASASICLGAAVIAARHFWGAGESPSPPLDAVEARDTEAPAASATRDIVTVDLPLDAGAPFTEAGANPSPPPAAVTVSVQGAVQSPGVYEIAGGGRVNDLIARAGGALAEADLGDINLAAPLVDGTTLHVPRNATGRIADGRLVVRGGTADRTPNPPEYTISRRGVSERAGTGPEQAAASGQAGPQTKLININTATRDELDTLPGVGPATAAAIIEYRQAQPFRTAEDLIHVRGIGPKKMESIRPLVTAGP